MVDKDGYILVRCLDHPFARHNGYIAEHRLVMEQKIGRYLTEDEVVHHIDGNPSNNDPSNLMIYLTNAEHKRDDYAYREIDELGRFKPKRKQEVNE